MSDAEFREQTKERVRQWRKDNPSRASAADRNKHYRRKYGISLDEYEALAAKQNHLCAICVQPERKGNFRRLAVDHCHTTGAIRGLLCSTCNQGIGSFEDNPERLRRAAEYLDG